MGKTSVSKTLRNRGRNNFYRGVCGGGTAFILKRRKC